VTFRIGFNKTNRVRLAERGGFEPPIRFNPYNGLANRRLQPLGHLSTSFGNQTSFQTSGKQILRADGSNDALGRRIQWCHTAAQNELRRARSGDRVFDPSVFLEKINHTLIEQLLDDILHRVVFL
jgi:hypothetical protein